MNLKAAFSESGRGLPHSKTLARDSVALVSPEGFGLRQPAAAFHGGWQTRMGSEKHNTTPVGDEPTSLIPKKLEPPHVVSYNY